MIINFKKQNISFAFFQNWINKIYTYNSKWELLSWYVNWNTIKYLYDSNSNRVEKASINWSWSNLIDI